MQGSPLADNKLEGAQDQVKADCKSQKIWRIRWLRWLQNTDMVQALLVVRFFFEGQPATSKLRDVSASSFLCFEGLSFSQDRLAERPKALEQSVAEGGVHTFCSKGKPKENPKKMSHAFGLGWDFSGFPLVRILGWAQGTEKRTVAQAWLRG